MTSTTLTGELERRCAAGVQTAAAELAASDPEGICQTFEVWRREARRPWTWLPGLCYDALGPLGVAFPEDDEAVVTAGRVLIGVETHAHDVREVWRRWQSASDATGPLDSPRDLPTQLHRRSLMSAVDTFWERLAETAREVGFAVAQGDRDRSDQMIRSSKRQLEDVAERIGVLAERIAEADKGTPERVGDDLDVWPIAIVDAEEEPAQEEAIPGTEQEEAALWGPSGATEAVGGAERDEDEIPGVSPEPAAHDDLDDVDDVAFAVEDEVEHERHPEVEATQALDSQPPADGAPADETVMLDETPAAPDGEQELDEMWDLDELPPPGEYAELEDLNADVDGSPVEEDEAVAVEPEEADAPASAPAAAEPPPRIVEDTEAWSIADLADDDLDSLAWDDDGFDPVALVDQTDELAAQAHDEEQRRAGEEHAAGAAEAVRSEDGRVIPSRAARRRAAAAVSQELDAADDDGAEDAAPPPPAEDPYDPYEAPEGPVAARTEAQNNTNILIFLAVITAGALVWFLLIGTGLLG